MTTSRNHIDKINKQNIMTDTVVNNEILEIEI